MNDTSIRDDDHTERIQIVVNESGDRNALEELLSDRYEAVVEETLEPVDCYLVGDRMLPAYRAELRDQVEQARPAFCPVLVLQRERANATVDQLFQGKDEAAPLVDDVIFAPVRSEVLYRRVANLLTRRQQSRRLAQRYERVETRFQQLFESTNEASFVVDPVEDTIVECNPAASDLVGYSRDELLGLSPSETLHSPEQETYQSFLQQVVATGEAWTDGLRCKTKEGNIRQLEISGARLDDGFTDHPSIILTARDVTERIQYQEELEWKTHAIETAPVGIFITDPHHEDNPIIYTNDGFKELTGYSESEVVGRNFRFLHGEKTRPEPVAEIREAVEARDPTTVELRNYRKDGSQFWTRLTIAPVANDDGRPTYFIGFQQDITERKESERELELFRKAVEQAGHGVVITNREGKIEYVNPVYARDTGYARERLLGLNPAVVKSGKHDDSFYGELWDTILSGDVWQADIINQRKSGELYEVDQTIAPITDETGETTHFVGIQSDVSEQRLREQQLAVFNRILRHNIRNTMNVVLGNTSLLLEQVDTREAKSQLQVVQDQATSLIDIGEKAKTIRDLVERERNADVSCDISELISNLSSQFRETYPDASITVAAPDGVFVRADDRLAEAIREAVDNAIVHNDTSVPEVAVSLGVSEQDGTEQMIDIVISDNGPGIPAEERALIEHGKETSLNHGTGIGLGLIHWVTRRFGGEMTIDENSPRGSRVTLRVPAATHAGGDV